MQEKPLSPEQAMKAEIFSLVDLARGLANISAYALCAEAKVSETTYWRLKKHRPHGWRRGTMRRLVKALFALKAIDDGRKAKFDQSLAALSRKSSSSNDKERNAA